MSIIREEYLGELIKDAIKKSGLKQSVIADKMGIKRQSLNQIDRKKTFGLDFLQRLKEASGLDFTNYDFRKEGKIKSEVMPNSEPVKKEKTVTVDLSLTIKISAEEDQISKAFEFLKSVRIEASKQGLNLI